ncbi:MAG TPA: hypothetical protein VER79_05930, partial [Candidatus Limnocylindrales bacterium]|nr:hypothetical protein [Candidatus Limnocylindrales bacterium]
EGRWSVPMPAPDGPHDALTRDWRSARVPADAAPGEAVVRLVDGTIIARYAVESLPLTTSAPPFSTSVDAAFPGVGDLLGFTLANEALSLTEAPQVTLVWRAGDGPAETSFTVFVQIIDAQGRVTAQSDALPAGGTRPTTGWRVGEIVEDAHTLTWNSLAAPGEATLIAGLYDTVTGTRVRLADGSDSALLEAGLRVSP